MRKTLLTIAIASASILTMTACSSSGWGQRGSQQSGGQASGSTHTLTGGAEAGPTSETTPRPAGPASNQQESGTPSGGAGTQGGTSSGTSGGTSSGTSGGGATEGGGAGGSMGTQPAQPVQPTENMGSSAGPTGTQSGGKNPQQPAE